MVEDDDADVAASAAGNFFIFLVTPLFCEYSVSAVHTSNAISGFPDGLGGMCAGGAQRHCPKCAADLV